MQIETTSFLEPERRQLLGDRNGAGSRDADPSPIGRARRANSGRFPEQAGISATLCGALACALLGSGCGDLEDELLEGLQTEEHQALCIAPALLGVDAFEANDGKRYVARAGDFSFMSSGSAVDALEVLQSEGYVSEEATSLPRNFANYFDAFEITAKGAEFFRPDAFGVGIDVCVGEKTATEIVEYTEPGEGGPQVIQAHFRYEISFNDFVDDLDIEEALEGEVSRVWPGEGQAVYTKTNKGWRLEHAMWQ